MGRTQLFLVHETPAGVNHSAQLRVYWLQPLVRRILLRIKGGFIFLSIRTSERRRRCSGRAQGATGFLYERVWMDFSGFSVMETPLGHWFLWCSVMKQCWDINYVLTRRQTMTCDSFTTCCLSYGQARYNLTFSRAFRWERHFGAEMVVVGESRELTQIKMYFLYKST